MRSQLVFLVIAFAIGVAVGERYGLPGFFKPIVDQGFGFIEGKIGRGGENSDAAEPSAGPSQQSSAAPGHPANAGLTINQAGLNIIKESEGLRLEAYQLGGQWLIGYGHSRTARAGMTITQAQAETLLREDVASSEGAVRKLARVQVNRNQFSAMVSLAYNLGSGGFSRSAVLDRLNKGDYQGAADGFRQHNRAGGIVDNHLTERREKERALFLS